jgi:hypothetical protein
VSIEDVIARGRRLPGLQSGRQWTTSDVPVALTAGLRRTLTLMKQDLAGYRRAGSHFSVLAMRGAIALARAQLRWLATIRGEVVARDDG